MLFRPLVPREFAPFGLLEPREFALFGPHWHRMEALTQLGALDGRFLGYAMRPSGVDLAGWCQSRLVVSMPLVQHARSFSWNTWSGGVFLCVS